MGKKKSGMVHYLTRWQAKLYKNKTTAEIELNLKISEKTVRNHISNVMQKLGVSGRAHAVCELLRLHEIEL